MDLFNAINADFILLLNHFNISYTKINEQLINFVFLDNNKKPYNGSFEIKINPEDNTCFIIGFGLNDENILQMLINIIKNNTMIYKVLGRYIFNY